MTDASAGPAAGTPGGRVLFIDDDRAGREVARFNLRKAGYDVTAASARELRIPKSDVEKGIVCVFPQRGGSVRLRTGDAAGGGEPSPESHQGDGRHAGRRGSGGS